MADQGKPRSDRRRRRRPEEAEAEILAAAEGLLRASPAHEVTVAAIMERTTLSRKSFWVYFRDRYDVIARLIAPLRGELDGHMRALAQPHGGGEESEREHLLAIARVYERHGVLLRALASASREDAEAARAWRGFVDPPVSLIEARLRQEIDAGLIAPLDPAAAARLLVGMNLTAFFEQLVEGESDAEPLVDQLLAIWRRALYPHG